MRRVFVPHGTKTECAAFASQIWDQYYFPDTVIPSKAM